MLSIITEDLTAVTDAFGEVQIGVPFHVIDGMTDPLRRIIVGVSDVVAPTTITPGYVEAFDMVPNPAIEEF